MSACATSTSPSIRVLPSLVADQIAAGEVVTRPASVVRELVDNSIDAHATKISVTIASGGGSLAQVVDDGHGMSPEDARLCVVRHATSKIHTADDLQAIESLGFRGEALPSIASVSRMRIRTRRAEDEQGTELELAAGEIDRVGPCGCAPGTTVEVRDLFFNVPARKKFMRALSTESALVTDTLVGVALARHEVSVSLTRDGRSVRRWPGCANRADRVADILGAESWIVSRAERGPMRVEAYLGPPDRSRVGAGGLRLVVNGRPVADRVLARAVAAAYGGALDRGRYPIGVVYLDLPAELVDVNVHPQKAEIRFAHARAVSDAVHSVVHAGVVRILGASAAASTSVEAPRRDQGRWHAAADRVGEPPRWQWSQSGRLSSTATSALEGADAQPGPAAIAHAHGRTDGGSEPVPVRNAAAADAARAGASPRCEDAAAARCIGALRNGCLVFDSEAGLSVLDPVAAARAELRAQAAQASLPIAPKPLLFPVVRDVAVAVAERVDRATAALAAFGLELRRSGKSTVSLLAVPSIVPSVDAEGLFDALLDALSAATLDEAGAEGLPGLPAFAPLLARHARLAPMESLSADRAVALFRAARDCPEGAKAGGLVARLDWSQLEVQTEPRS